MEGGARCRPADAGSGPGLLRGKHAYHLIYSLPFYCPSRLDLTSDLCVGGGLPPSVCVWCQRAGAGYCRNSRDWFKRLEKQHRVQRRWEDMLIILSLSVNELAGQGFSVLSEMLLWNKSVYLNSVLVVVRLSWWAYCDPVVLGCGGALQ